MDKLTKVRYCKKSSDFEYFYRKNEVHILLELVSKENISPEILERLAGHKSISIRYRVARHLNSNRETLKKLKLDTEVIVRDQANLNYSTL